MDPFLINFSRILQDILPKNLICVDNNDNNNKINDEYYKILLIILY